ncbi:MAG: hypothetical protein HN348_12830 [Proteobacteria bacterium]|nr:hypothetical protein [Pseudomonadota bacterium]
MSLLALLISLAVALAGDCPQKSTPSEVDVQLARAEDAYSSLDVPLFTASLNNTMLLVPCLGEVMPAATAARYHRLMGLLLYGEDSGKAMAALQAARVLEPGYLFPETLLSKGHMLRQEYSVLSQVGEFRRVGEPRRGSLFFDGTKSNNRPKERASLVQFQGQNGATLQSAYLFYADPLPEYRAIPRKRNALIAGTAGAAVVSGLFYGLALSSRKGFYDEDSASTLEELEALRARTNGLLVASGVMAGVGVAGVVGIFLIGEQ